MEKCAQPVCAARTWKLTRFMWLAVVVMAGQCAGTGSCELVSVTACCSYRCGVGHTHTSSRVRNNKNNKKNKKNKKNNNNTTWRGSVSTGEEPPPHPGKLKHALTQAGGPTQSQLSRPMSSRHHISMEHRVRRKHLLLNPDTNARKEK